MALHRWREIGAERGFEAEDNPSGTDEAEAGAEPEGEVHRRA